MMQRKLTRPWNSFKLQQVNVNGSAVGNKYKDPKSVSTHKTLPPAEFHCFKAQTFWILWLIMKRKPMVKSICNFQILLPHGISQFEQCISQIESFRIGLVRSAENGIIGMSPNTYIIILGYIAKTIPYHHTYAILTATLKFGIPDIDIKPSFFTTLMSQK